MAMSCTQAAQDRRNALAGIDILRKICNHPDLLQRAKWEGAPDYGNPVRSGKLTVAMKARAARPLG
jgi:DNA excision repair protein ERCC-6